MLKVPALLQHSVGGKEGGKKTLQQNVHHSRLSPSSVVALAWFSAHFFTGEEKRPRGAAIVVLLMDAQKDLGH